MSRKIRLIAVLAMAASALMGGTAGCGSDAPAPTVDAAPSVSTHSSISPSSSGRQIVFRFDDQAVPATLSDAAVSRQFAALLPMTVVLRDPMGQAKSGPLPYRIEPIEAVTIADPQVGGIYLTSGGETLAVFYDDLGQTVPAPGLIRLGTVDADLTALADAGNRLQVSVDLVEGASS